MNSKNSKISKPIDGIQVFINTMSSIQKLQGLYKNDQLIVDSHLWQWLNHHPEQLTARWMDVRLAYLECFSLSVCHLPELNQDDTLKTMKAIFNQWHFIQHKKKTGNK